MAPALGTRTLIAAGADSSSSRPPTRRGESRFREARDSLLREVPAPPPAAVVAMPPMPPTPTAEELPMRIKRKTILERIEGWWDLGLVRGGTVRGRAAPFPVAERKNGAFV